MEKVTLNLFEGEFDKLRDLYGRQGGGKIVRDLVHSHLETIAKKMKERMRK